MTISAFESIPVLLGGILGLLMDEAVGRAVADHTKDVLQALHLMLSRHLSSFHFAFFALVIIVWYNSILFVVYICSECPSQICPNCSKWILHQDNEVLLACNLFIHLSILRLLLNRLQKQNWEGQLSTLIRCTTSSGPFWSLEILFVPPLTLTFGCVQGLLQAEISLQLQWMVCGVHGLWICEVYFWQVMNEQLGGRRTSLCRCCTTLPCRPQASTGAIRSYWCEPMMQQKPSGHECSSLLWASAVPFWWDCVHSLLARRLAARQLVWF